MLLYPYVGIVNISLAVHRCRYIIIYNSRAKQNHPRVTFSKRLGAQNDDDTSRVVIIYSGDACDVNYCYT